MRWSLIVLMVFTLAVPMAIAAGDRPLAPAPCTEVGTDRDDVLAGGRGRDVICARGGHDYVSGNGAMDVLRGGPGRDVLVGGAGRDTLRGRGGNDRLFLVDGRGGGLADGGKGTDQCFVDPGDQIKSCETLHIGSTLQVAEALADAFHGGLVLAEDLIAEETSPPPPTVAPVTVTITQTITQTVSFPPCSPPPPVTPAAC